jgi:two-component system, NtrC family, response regulator AtoC
VAFALCAHRLLQRGTVAAPGHRRGLDGKPQILQQASSARLNGSDMRPSVLIVEDETVLAKNIKTYLERHGFDARAAVDGDQALSALARCRPDVVLVDYNLPGMNGLTLIERIHRLDSGLPIIMLTGHGNSELAARAAVAGASDYLTKPVALSTIKRTLERVI